MVYMSNGLWISERIQSSSVTDKLDPEHPKGRGGNSPFTEGDKVCINHILGLSNMINCVSISHTSLGPLIQTGEIAYCQSSLKLDKYGSRVVYPIGQSVISHPVRH